MWTLFSTDSAQAGFRLDYMEVYNWGTFHNAVYRITPQGTTSLLTGANGSGKTTWIDALLTLLVPEKRYRFYNQSSGTEKRGDRTEETYVLGNYGDIQEEGKRSTTVQQLRSDRKSVYSILLAHFRNADNESVTIFQTRWFVGSELKRVYGVAAVPLSIKDDFTPFDPHGSWKKALEKKYRSGMKKMVEFPDGARRYAERLVRMLGMRSVKALSLFNLTVGIKVLGNLDEFIRLNMLEQQNTEEDFMKLLTHFQTLLEASRNIDKAARQIELLEPVKACSEELQGLQRSRKELSDLMDTSKFWFAERSAGLVDAELYRRRHELLLLEERGINLQHQLEKRRIEEREIALNIERDEVGQRIRELEKQSSVLLMEMEKRKKKSEQYNRLALQINLPENPDEDNFYGNISLLGEKKADIDRKIAGIDESIYRIKSSVSDLKEKMETGLQQLEFLTGQKNNITDRAAEIRDEIAGAIGADRMEIPFVGELIRVKADESRWESAIERLLHNFALRLLVPEKYYDRVSSYVNSTDLQGRIVYHKFKKMDYLDSFSSVHEDSLLNKLEFHPDSACASWVEHSIRERYDHLCTDDLGEFKRCRKAITSSGLIKSSDRHEKDDRPNSRQRDNYVLGWDNSEKIRWWQQELRLYEKEMKELAIEVERESQLRKVRELFRENISKFEVYSSFDEIDWKRISGEIQRLSDEREQLEISSDTIKELKKGQDDLGVKIRSLERERESIIGERTKADTEIGNLADEKSRGQELLKLKDGLDVDFEAKYSEFEEALSEHLLEIDLGSIDRVRQKVTGVLGKRKDQCDSSVSECERELQKLIMKFKYPDEETAQRFRDWRNETYQLPEDTGYVDEYLRFLDRLQRDDLPAYKKRFEDYLSTTMIHKIADFNQSLNDWLENIDESIISLNDSLKAINFRKGPEETFIQLRSHNRINEKVQNFRQMLGEALPDVSYWSPGKEDFAKKESHFIDKIMPLIHKLEEDVEWRREVIDVRNWKSFYAEEYYRETGKTMKSYTEMGRLSGGEKAQLTYTILGSALAYQFGITIQGLESRSFRFIAVDESFSNQDDEKATYLMDLCRQLHLQLLVVTPSDKIPVVEPYISCVHFVQRIGNRESLMYDMPIRQFRVERERLGQGS